MRKMIILVLLTAWVITIGITHVNATESITALFDQKHTVSTQLIQDQETLNHIQAQIEGTRKQRKLAKQTEQKNKKIFKNRSLAAIDHPEIETKLAKDNYVHSKQRRINLEEREIALKLKYQSAKVAVNADQSSLAGIEQQITALQEQKLRKEIEKVTTVIARGESGCSEHISMGQCKDAALADAKRGAAEQAVSMIESDTKVKDFIVQSDMVHSRVHALIKGFKVLGKGVIGDGIGYFYEIEAQVQGQYVSAQYNEKRLNTATSGNTIKQMRDDSKECTGTGEDYLNKAARTFTKAQKKNFLKLAIQYCPHSPRPYIAMADAMLKYKFDGYIHHAKGLYKTALRIDLGNIEAKKGLQKISNQPQTKHTRKPIDNIFHDIFE